MPRKTSGQKSSFPAPSLNKGVYWLPNDATWGGFINIRLPEDAKIAFNAWWQDNPHQANEILDDVLGAGAKFGLSYDAENQCYIATLGGRLLLSANERYVVTTRAGTLAEVVALAMWKHAFYAKGDYDSYRPRSQTMLSWG